MTDRRRLQPKARAAVGLTPREQATGLDAVKNKLH